MQACQIGYIGTPGELYFYYMPDKIFKRRYVNCYEVPTSYNISEEEYMGLISKLYNKIVILADILKSDIKSVTLIIEKGNCKLELEDKKKSNFGSKENHIIWRYRYLNIEPLTGNEQKVLKKYFASSESKTSKEVMVFPAIKEKRESIIDFQKVLSVEEAIARSITIDKKAKKLEEKLRKKKERKNKKGILFSDEK